MKDRIIPLTKKLISLQTTPDHPDQLEEALNLVLSELSEFTIEIFNKNGVKSALIYNTDVRPSKFKLVINGHLDVIPGDDGQYIPRIEGDRLYGVGAMDMKANLVTALLVFKEVARQVNYPIALQIVTDEEIGGFDGTKHQIEEGVRADFVLSVEPTNFDIVHEAKGVLWLKVTASGATAHGAYPWRGDNAILKIHSFLESLKYLFSEPLEQVWETTCNVASIESSNKTFNKIPDECHVSLDIRFVPGGEGILNKIRSILPEGCVLEVLANEPALNTDKNNPYLSKLSLVTSGVINKEVVFRGAQGSSDARHYQLVKIEGIEFGPIGDGIGSDNEWVSISSLEQFYDILVNYIKSLNERKNFNNTI